MDGDHSSVIPHPFRLSVVDWAHGAREAGRDTLIMMNDTFAREYQEMVRALEAIIAEYPAEMRGALRSYAADVLNARLQQMWRERLRERLLREEWELPDTAGEAGAGGAAQ